MVLLGLIAVEVVAFVIPLKIAESSDEGSMIGCLLWPVLALVLPFLYLWALA